jgi:threonine aldolase
MRFLAAPWVALLTDDVWLRNARHANTGARKLADRLRDQAKIDIVFPVESNAVFIRLRENSARDLQARGWHFYKFIEPDVYRLMCAWSVTDNDIDRIVVDLRQLNPSV